MKNVVLALVFSVMLVSGAGAHIHCPDAKCEKTKQKIRTLQAKMRQGYSRAQGEKWRTQLRELRALRSKQCR